MRHQVHGKKLNRSSGHRRALYKNLVQSLVDHERITTTLVKAKAVRPVVEKLITRAKDQDLSARRAVASFLPTQVSATKVYEDLAPRFANRPGGYTRVIKIGRRLGDGTEMAVIEFVEQAAPVAKKAEAKKSTPKKQDKPTSKKQDEVKEEEVSAESTQPEQE